MTGLRRKREKEEVEKRERERERERERMKDLENLESCLIFSSFINLQKKRKVLNLSQFSRWGLCMGTEMFFLILESV